MASQEFNRARCWRGRNRRVESSFLRFALRRLHVPHRVHRRELPCAIIQLPLNFVAQ
jgi:hypothetical protein